MSPTFLVLAALCPSLRAVASACARLAWGAASMPWTNRLLAAAGELSLWGHLGGGSDPVLVLFAVRANAACWNALVWKVPWLRVLENFVWALLALRAAGAAAASGLPLHVLFFVACALFHAALGAVRWLWLDASAAVRCLWRFLILCSGAVVAAALAGPASRWAAAPGDAPGMRATHEEADVRHEAV